jgi:hypothetical protein
MGRLPHGTMAFRSGRGGARDYRVGGRFCRRFLSAPPTHSGANGDEPLRGSTINAPSVIIASATPGTRVA